LPPPVNIRPPASVGGAAPRPKAPAADEGNRWQ
jgi:hypothetical protein